MWDRVEAGAPAPLHVSPDMQVAMAKRADERIRVGAIRMCERLFDPEHKCASNMEGSHLRVRSQNKEANAFIDENYNITVDGGLFGFVESEDELAAVLAHEYAHGIMEHSRRRMRNKRRRSLLGLALGTIAGASDEPDRAGDWVRRGIEWGQRSGERACRVEMETEADHLALFILDDAGYDIEAASHFHIRRWNGLSARHGPRGNSNLMYFRTHSGSLERIRNLIGTGKMIEAGHLQPAWQP